VVGVLPQSQTRITRVSVIYDPVLVASKGRPIIFRQSQKSIGTVGFGLRCEVAEELRTIVYDTVAIAIEEKPRFVLSCAGPGK